MKFHFLFVILLFLSVKSLTQGKYLADSAPVYIDSYNSKMPKSHLKFTNLHGATLTMTSLGKIRSLMNLKFNPVTDQWIQQDCLTKFALDHLIYKFNFTVRHIPNFVGNGGARLTNGSWVGLAADLISRKADLSGIVTQNVERNKVVDFSFPITMSGMTFVSGNPVEVYTWKAIWWPLDINVWIATVISWAGAAAVFSFRNFLITMGRFEKFQQKQNGGTFLYTVFLGQDKTLYSEEHSMRLLVAFWLIFGILITTAYGAKLVILISFPVTETLPETFDELADTSQNEFQVQILDVGPAVVYFKHSTNAAVKKLSTRLHVVKSAKTCLATAIEDSHRPCIIMRIIAGYVLQRYFMDFYSNEPPPAELREIINVTPLAMMYRKGLPYKESFDWALRNAMAFGMYELWQKMDAESIRLEKNKEPIIEMESSEEEEQDPSGAEPLELKHFIGANYLFLLGNGLGILAFIAEYHVYQAALFYSITSVS